MEMTVQEFHKLHETKLNKLKRWTLSMANLIFQSWLKDIKIHVEDWNLTQREAIQLVKDVPPNTPMTKWNFIWTCLWRTSKISNTS